MLNKTNILPLKEQLRRGLFTVKTSVQIWNDVLDDVYRNTVPLTAVLDVAENFVYL
jgi:hypothetical protein